MAHKTGLFRNLITKCIARGTWFCVAHGLRASCPGTGLGYGFSVDDSREFFALAIFALSYGFLAFDRLPLIKLDRVSGVLVGAVAMVGFGVINVESAWQAIDGRTLMLLIGMMILNVAFQESGFFGWLSARLFTGGQSPRVLLVALILTSGILSALFLNDTVCLMLSMPLLALLKARGLPRAPYLVALAMSANIGSVMTVVGNPQNMLIQSESGYAYLPFLVRMAPVGLIGLAVLTGILLWVYRDHFGPSATLRGPENSKPLPLAPEIDAKLMGLTGLALVGVLIGFTLSQQLGLVAMAGAASILLFSGRPASQILARVDWLLIVFFASLFVVMAGLSSTDVLSGLSDWLGDLGQGPTPETVALFSGLTILGSNLVSNVPFVLLIRETVAGSADPGLMWLVLAMASGFAGNLTVPGSIATLIVLRAAGREDSISFLHFSLIGVPVTLITTALGGLLLWWLGGPTLHPPG